MGNILEFRRGRRRGSWRISDKPSGLSWRGLLRQIQEARKQAERLLESTPGDRRVIGNEALQVVRDSGESAVYALSVIGSRDGTALLSNEISLPPPNVIGSLWYGESPMGGRKVLEVLPKAPLRLIVARYPEGSIVREKLECGHWNTFYGYWSESKRRRCWDCRDGRPVKMPPELSMTYSSWMVEGGTNGGRKRVL